MRSIVYVMCNVYVYVTVVYSSPVCVRVMFEYILSTLFDFSAVVSKVYKYSSIYSSI